jgi:hypothetical protein
VFHWRELLLEDEGGAGTVMVDLVPIRVGPNRIRLLSRANRLRVSRVMVS